MDTTENPGTSNCSRCGAAFGCAMADGLDGPCWCTALPPAMPLPGPDASCLCPGCLKAVISAQAGNHTEAPAAKTP
ncbi:cysteine-rich CWC family protein [Pseudoduganella sp. GCM10020061]|uniref:cysteine-rich CWC family protein n=1 Tax=Pseudoduganella sp. GCM10020061 TaxID=3317345 RepID=UPI0036334F0E